MSETNPIEVATKRLAAALDSLEAALNRRRELDGREAALSAQVAALGADRSRLAAELDQQTARSLKLDAAARDAARRLDLAMDAVRAVVNTQER